MPHRFSLQVRQIAKCVWAVTANHGPSRLTATIQRSRQPLARPSGATPLLGSDLALHSSLDPTPPAPAVDSRNHKHSRGPAATFNGASNSPQRPCFTKPHREATVSTARTGSGRLMAAVHLGSLFRGFAIMESGAGGVPDRGLVRVDGVLSV